jgi:ADP-ribose pyrophosphatase YjhB (NUDIX family)
VILFEDLQHSKVRETARETSAECQGHARALSTHRTRVQRSPAGHHVFVAEMIECRHGWQNASATLQDQWAEGPERTVLMYPT